jgi:transposase
LFTPLPTATRLMIDATSTASTTPPVTAANLDRFARLDSLGLTVTGQQIFPDHAVLFCQVTVPDDRCPGCGQSGSRHDTVRRRFTHLPLGHRPTWLQVATPRYECQRCGKVWRHRLRSVARRRSRLTRAAGMWALAAVVLDHVPVSSVARILGVAWQTAHAAVAELGRELLISHPTRLDGVLVIGVDEHCWRHTGFASDRFVTVIVDLTPVRDRSGPARLIDMVEGRSSSVFQAWLDAQPATFRNTVEVVAMDDFTGFKTAAAQAIPAATTVMDPFHVVALVGDKLDLARQRVQHDTLGHRGRTGDPIYAARRTLRTGESLLTDKQQIRLAGLFADQAHLPVEVGWCVYQDVIAAYRNPDKTLGKAAMTRIIEALRAGVPAGLEELAQLGRTLHRRRDDILAWFTHPHASNGPTEAVCESSIGWSGTDWQGCRWSPHARLPRSNGTLRGAEQQQETGRIELLIRGLLVRVQSGEPRTNAGLTRENTLAGPALFSVLHPPCILRTGR